LGTFEQYLRKAAAGIKFGSGRQAELQPRIQELERELLALARENQSLAGKLERFRADYERLRSTDLHTIETLAQAHRDYGTATTAHAGRLSELEQGLVEIQSEGALEHERIKALEDFLAGTKNRLEIRDNQLKFLQDSAREQLQLLKSSLAEASSRLETRDNELAHRQDAERDRIGVLETSLAEASRRFETTESEISAMRAQLLTQTQQLEASRASANTLFEATTNQVGTLEKKLELEHTLQQNLFRDAETQLRKQDTRLKRVTAAAFILVLAAVAGAVIFWLVR
jgi:chromosome segregation ATPase